MPSRTVHELVARSDVRRAVLRAVAGGGATTDDLLAAVDASRSAVYKAVDALADAGLVVRRDGRVATTGRGDVLAGCFADRDRLAGLLDDDYWTTHDAGVLPTRFRRRLPALTDADVVADPDTDPTRTRRYARDVVRDATQVDAFVRTFDPELAAAVDDVAERASPRLLVEDRLVDGERPDPAPESAWHRPHVTERVGGVPCSLCVTGEHLLLALPTLDGDHDPSTLLHATGDDALAWGRDLFETYWEAATDRPAAARDTTR